MANIQIFEIRQELQNLADKKKTQKEKDFVQHYLGTQKKCLCVKTGELVKIAKKIVKSNLSGQEITNLLDDLFFGETIEEHIIGGKIFTFLSPENRAKIPFANLKKWFQNSHGWVEVDVICQSAYTAPEVLANWQNWEKLIKDYSKSMNIQVRRASLVLQNPSVRKSNDQKIRHLAYETIDKLKPEREILITKAVSWLLRSLVILNKEEVKNYLIKNKLTLPKIAYRETLRKISTGKK